MNEPSEGIRITDLDVEVSQPSSEGPGFRRLYLKLSDHPSPEWVKIFEELRRFPTARTWRSAWVVGDHIVIECIPAELEQAHLNHLKEDVAKANSTFWECEASKRAERLSQLRERVEVRKQLVGLRALLKFD